MEESGNGSKKNGNGGRPRLSIDYTLVERLALIHCTQDEIAGALGVSTRTLQRNKEFCHIYKKGVSKGRRSLRRLQFEKAEGRDAVQATTRDGGLAWDDKGRPILLSTATNPDTTMQIWLGKQLLGQKDTTLIANPAGDSFKVDVDVDARSAEKKLLSFLDRIATRSAEANSDPKP